MCPSYQNQARISTHAPLARRDFIVCVTGNSYIISTHAPLARRDYMCPSYQNQARISTHAPLARRDSAASPVICAEIHFYSRASCEARLLLRCMKSILSAFLLTRLLRGATEAEKLYSFLTSFLLTRLLRGATWRLVFRSLYKNFYSRASCEARRFCRNCLLLGLSFLLTRLLRGATSNVPKRYGLAHFYSRASCEARHSLTIKEYARNGFLLTRLLRGATRARLTDHIVC